MRMLSLEKTFIEKLRAMYQAAPIDISSFHRHYKTCSLSDCFGLCCHGGTAFYLPEEADVMRTLAKTQRAFFDKQGLSLEGNLFEEEKKEETGEMILSTGIRPASYPEGLMPAHFPSTACVFKRADGACSLQLLGSAENKHPWSYKPVACWMFPLELELNGKPHIHVAHASTDEYVDAEYPGFVEYTRCGAECKTGGKPAYEVLKHEIAEVSRLIDRDILSEVLAQKENVA